MADTAETPGWGYWFAAIVLISFGTLTGFSIGIPFLCLGLALVLLAPFRHRAPVFVPSIVALLGFFIGFILVTPLGCTVTDTVQVTSSGGATSVSPAGTTCSNVVGIAYSGTGIYNPPLWPAALAGVATAGLAGAIALFFLRRHSSQEKLNGRSLGWFAVGLNAAWTLFLAGLGLFSDGALDPQWRTALLFVGLAGLPAVVAIFGLRGRPALLLTAGIICLPLSFMSLAGATLPLLLPGCLYLISYARS